MFIASNVYAFLPYAKSVFYLKENEGVCITLNGYEVFSIESGISQKPDIEYIKKIPQKNSLSRYQHHLIKEIYEQKETIHTVANFNENEFKKLNDMVGKGYEIITTGCGTASYCGMIAQYFFAKAGLKTTHYNANEIAPFLHSLTKRYYLSLFRKAERTADTIIAAKQAKLKGAHIVALINVRGSTWKDWLIPCLLQRLDRKSLFINKGFYFTTLNTLSFFNNSYKKFSLRERKTFIFLRKTVQHG